MKNKLVTISLLGVLSLTLTACTLTADKTKPESLQSSNSSTESEKNGPDSANETTFTGKITELMGFSENVKCTISGNEDYTGTIYLSNNKLRADVTATIRDSGDSQEIETHMINDGDWLYTWSDLLPMGFKMNVSEIDTDSAQGNAPTDQGAAMNNEFEYKCSPWVIDQSVFALPSNINFTDASGLIDAFSQ